LHVSNFRIGEAAVLIECPNGQAIFVHLSGEQSSAFVKEGKKVPRTRLHDLDQVSFSDALVAEEIDSPDDQAWSLGDLEEDAGLIGSRDLLDAILHVDFREVAILVDFQNLLAIRFQFFLGEHFANFRAYLASEAAKWDLLGAFDNYLLDDGPPLQQNRYPH